MNNASPNAIAKATEKVADLKPTAPQDAVRASIDAETGQVRIESDGRGGGMAGRGEPVGIAGKPEAATRSEIRAETIRNIGDSIEQTLKAVQDACGATDGCLN